MNNQTRWKATWTDHTGQVRELLFRGAPSRLTARLDFQLRLFDLGERIPERFELRERQLPTLRPTRLVRA
jgi:hypothetical protein